MSYNLICRLTTVADLDLSVGCFEAGKEGYGRGEPPAIGGVVFGGGGGFPGKIF